ncbi:MAG: alkaline phosphatase family protein [Solirubrobacteraceae bacterium]
MAALLAVGVLLAVAVASTSGSASSSPSGRAQFDSPAHSNARLSGIHKIRHVVVIMQENRSFDNYFGTYPRARGIPGLAGHRGKVPCIPDPGERCVRPFHDRRDLNWGGPYHFGSSLADIDGGKMDGFIRKAESACRCTRSVPPDDVMGYHTGKDIPNYWKYARRFVLQDHMFGSVASWSLPSHLFLVSMWSAQCKTHNDPASCSNTPQRPDVPPGWKGNETRPVYAWTDLTYLLHRHHVSWRYYIFNGTEPLCESDATQSCGPVTAGSRSVSLWYPLRWFDTVRDDKQTGNVQSIKHLFAAASSGRLPAVSWVIPSGVVSEHTYDTSRISAGQTYVTGLINRLMRSPDWKSTAIFLTWDDWGGLYDNVSPPRVDENGYGLRVPGLVISPYAKRGYVDHQTLSFDAYAKFIEDDFLHKARLNPGTDGRPDPRPDVRENAPQLGNLIKDFNFKQAPRKPLILPVHPKTDLIELPSALAWRPPRGLGWG